MPLTTPNFALPYPVPGDPADVPTALETLAEAIDDPLYDEDLRAVPRPMAQFLGTIPNVIPGTSVVGTLTWQLTDFNTHASPSISGGMEQAIVPVVDATTTELSVNFAGYWFVFATVQVVTSVATIDEIAIEFLVNGSSTPHITRSSTHNVTTGGGDVTHLLDISAGITLAAGDRVSVRGAIARNAGSAPVTFNNRSITLLRMSL